MAHTSSDEPYSHSFTSKDAGTTLARKLYLTNLLRACLLVIVAVMCALSIYWGALWKTFTLVHGLNAFVVDFDGGPVGQAVAGAFSHISGPSTLTWQVIPASTFPNGPSDVAAAILKQRAWAAISINPGASNALTSAATAADATYNGSLAITIYAEEARNENSYSFIMLPIIEGTLISVMQNFSNQFVASLGSQPATNLAALLARAPSVVTRPVYYTVANLRPFDIAVGVAIDFVGLIYLLIVAFIGALLNTNIRQLASGLERRLTLRSLIAVRLVVPLAIYFVISLFYSLVSVAFQVPFNRVFGRGGFVIYWMLSFLGMSALGLAVEAMVTLLTPRFIAFFLIFWIICNVSVSFFPIEVLPSIFRYGYATPFYNVSKGVRTILFNTKNELGLNFGVLFVWIAISLVTIPIFQTFVRRGEVRAYRAQQAAQAPAKDEERAAARNKEGSAGESEEGSAH